LEFNIKTMSKQKPKRNKPMHQIARQEQKLELPRSCYLNDDGAMQVARESQEVVRVERLDWTDGVKLYIQGAEYPQKGFVEPQTMWLLNVVKRDFINSVMLLARWQFIPALVLLAMKPVKHLELFLHTFADKSDKVINSIYLKEQYRNSVGKELDWLVYSFLKRLKVSEMTSERMGKIFSHMIELDNAYRFRLNDIMSETDKARLLANPRKEIKRLLKIYSKRDDGVVVRKFTAVAQLLLWALWIPKVRKAFNGVLLEINLRNLQYDDSDRYWVCFRKDYKFMGLTYEERIKMLDDFNKPEFTKQ